jgi:type IV pilus assembly protein PilB
VLAERNHPGVNISTAEDPNRIFSTRHHPGAGNSGKRHGFRLDYRAFMRQDPDVILVGETRDKETAKTANRGRPNWSLGPHYPTHQRCRLGRDRSSR